MHSTECAFVCINYIYIYIFSGACLQQKLVVVPLLLLVFFGTRPFCLAKRFLACHTMYSDRTDTPLGEIFINSVSSDFPAVDETSDQKMNFKTNRSNPAPIQTRLATDLGGGGGVAEEMVVMGCILNTSIESFKDKICCIKKTKVRVSIR